MLERIEALRNEKCTFYKGDIVKIKNKDGKLIKGCLSSFEKDRLKLDISGFDKTWLIEIKYADIRTIEKLSGFADLIEKLEEGIDGNVMQAFEDIWED